MKHHIHFFFAVLFSTTFFYGCSALHLSSPQRTATEKFQQDVDAVLSDSNFIATQAAIKIVSLNNNEVLYDRNSKLLMRPASNMKLLTTAAALSELGTSYTLNTELYSDSTIENGTLKGNIYIKGFGDPDFTTEKLSQLLASLTARGIKKIEGNIVGDATFFDNQSRGTGWMWDDEPFGYAAYNSALSINQNCVTVTVTPSKKNGATPDVLIEPSTRYVTLENNAKTISDTMKSDLEISRKFAERLNVVTVNGNIPLNKKPIVEHITMLNPDMYLLTLAKEILEKNNIAVTGNLVLQKTPSSARLVTYNKQPIDSMIIFLNKESDNLSAENTLKILGARKYGEPGSTENGISIVKRTLASFGIDSTKFYVVDGSGVSHYNLLTSEIYIQLLQGMYKRKDIFDLYFASLPNAGIDGSLERRMKNSPAQNNLHAKTGSISGVSSLAGYVRTTDGELLAFSMMMQNFIGSHSAFRKAQDAIGILMASLKGRKK